MSAWTAAAWSRASRPLALARQVDAAEGLVFAGLQAYEGHLQNVMPFEERRTRVLEDMRKALTAKEYIEAAGLEVGEVSGCGTGTHTVTGRLPWMTELQCGSYATMDAQYAAVGGADYENALTVLVTVISRPRPEMAVVDAGLKAVTPEFGDPTVLVEGATWHDFSEEHGEVAVSGPAQGLRVGDKIELDPSARLHHGEPLRRYHVVEDGALSTNMAGRGARTLPVDGSSPRACVEEGGAGSCPRRPRAFTRSVDVRPGSPTRAFLHVDDAAEPCA